MEISGINMRKNPQRQRFLKQRRWNVANRKRLKSLLIDQAESAAKMK